MINQLYSNVYVGDSSISRIYQGENLIFVSEHPDILLEYIDNGQAANRPNVYFDTGVYPDSSTSVEIVYQTSIHPVPGVGDSTILFGCTQLSSAGYSFSGDFYMAAPYYRNSAWYAYRTATFGDIDPQGTADTNKHMYKVVANNLTTTTYFDDSSISFSYSTHRTMEITAYLFGRHYNSTYNLLPQKGTRIYYCKIWKSNNLVRFYIPVLHWNNGQYVPCFYDKVNDTYTYNLGTDTPTYKIQGDYLLDYLGAQPETAVPTSLSSSIRYETSIYPSYDLQVDLKSRMLYGRENYICASATDSTTTPAWIQFGVGVVGNGENSRVYFGTNQYGNRYVTISQVGADIIKVHKYSFYFDTSHYGQCYLDDTLQSVTSDATSILPPNTLHLFSRHGNSQDVNVANGSRIYYANFTNSNIPTKTFIPVLHNNQAAFLDLNSGTYIYNLGTAAPYYQFKN